MCGIFGSTLQYTEGKEIYTKKLAIQNSRGPDFNELCYFNNGLVLGHNRLAILDLDKRSNQPFRYEGTIIVFNGEIYNYKSLREELLQKNYAFRTNSDTEVICAAYLEYGEECVNKFNGMFAFVIYDLKKNILFGARDRLGKKPFYYYFSAEGFEFASKLSAIQLGNQLNIDDEGIIKYLYWNYIPEPYSPFKKVFKLPAATSFIYDLNNNKLNKKLFWDLPAKNSVAFDSFPEAKYELNSLLAESVTVRMQADVPLGVFLSGGVDSSLVASVAQANSVAKVKTFSVKFNETGFDESAYAREVAAILNTDHIEIECSYNEGIEFIKDFSAYYDEPFADSSAIPTLLLSKYTKQHVTVALSGDGGDETFLGYNIYDTVMRRKNLYNIPYPLRNFSARLLKLVPGYKFNLISRGLQLKSIQEYYLSFYKTINTDWIKGDELHSNYSEYLFNENKNLLEAISDFDTKAFMNGDAITKVERASMSYSLEVRSPLMDYRIVEFVRKIPTNFKYNNGDKKHILKEVLYDYLPRELFERKKKGFSMPLNIWFRTILKDYLLEAFSEKNFEVLLPYINRAEFMKLVDQHLAGKWDHSTRIWKVLVLLNWFKTYRS